MAQTLPDSFPAGTTVKFSASSSSYPSPAWAMALQVAGASVLRKAGSASVPAGGFDFVLTAVDTAALVPGTYSYRLVVSKSGEVYEFERGVFEVLRDFSAAGEGDAQAWAEKALKLVEDRLLERYSEDMETFAIGSRTVAQIPKAELEATRARLIEEIRLAKAGGEFIREVRATFTDVSSES
jgi:hypothetical protein